MSKRQLRLHHRPTETLFHAFRSFTNSNSDPETQNSAMTVAIQKLRIISGFWQS